MLNKINFQSILVSMGIGVLIGMIYIFFLNQNNSLSEVLIILFVSSLIGLIIGSTTELFTSLLPISIANPVSFVVINALIGFIITVCALVAIDRISMSEAASIPLFKICSMAAVIIFIANYFEYKLYKRVNEKLNAYKLNL